MVLMGQVQSLRTGAPGLVLFVALIGLNFLFIVVAGVPIFVTCIAEEKEEQTLGLLRMTNLSIGAILFGKSTSRLATLLVIMAAQLPFLLLAVTLGGVMKSQVAAAVIALLGLMILIANIALLWSVICQRAGPAICLSFGTLWLLAVLPGTLQSLVQFAASSQMLANDPLLAPWIQQANAILTFVHSFSPFQHFSMIMSAGYGGAIVSRSFVGCLLIAAFCFALSWMLFDRCTRKPTDQAPRPVGRANGRLAIIAPDRTWHSAVLWKDFYFLAGGKGVMVLKTFVALCILVAAYQESGRLEPASTLFSFWIFLEFAFHGAGLFQQEIQEKTLAILYGLPIRWGDIIRQKIRARLLAMLPPLGGWALAFFSDFALNQETILGLVAATTIAILLGYVSCWFSFRMRWGAPFVAAIAILMVNMFTFMFISFFSAFLFMNSGGEILGFLVFLLIQLAWIVVAHTAIRTRLKQEVTA
jgi:hypothetical protein